MDEIKNYNKFILSLIKSGALTLRKMREIVLCPNTDNDLLKSLVRNYDVYEKLIIQVNERMDCSN